MSMPNLAQHEASAIEWMAWQSVVAEWDRVISTTMNDSKYDRLIAAIRYWGEELHALRNTQSVEDQDRARLAIHKSFSDLI